MFIRKRKGKGPKGAAYEYYALVETYRVNGKVRQRTLYHMGKRSTLAEVIAWEQNRMPFVRAYPDFYGPEYVSACEARIEWLKSVVTKLEARATFGHYSEERGLFDKM
jgi:hypothetical protein